jgi:hypothetical protein
MARQGPTDDAERISINPHRPPKLVFHDAALASRLNVPKGFSVESAVR